MAPVELLHNFLSSKGYDSDYLDNLKRLLNRLDIDTKSRYFADFLGFLRTTYGIQVLRQDLIPSGALPAAACHTYDEQQLPVPCDIAEVEPKLRRLNALSRLLHINETICTAIAFIRQTGDLELVISTNKPVQFNHIYSADFTIWLLMARIELLQEYAWRLKSTIDTYQQGYWTIQNDLYAKLLFLAEAYFQANSAISYLVGNAQKYGRVFSSSQHDPYSSSGYTTARARLIVDLVKVAYGLLGLDSDPEKNFSKEEADIILGRTFEPRFLYLCTKEKSTDAWLAYYVTYAQQQLGEAESRLQGLRAETSTETPSEERAIQQKSLEERLVWCQQRVEKLRVYTTPSVSGQGRDQDQGVVHAEVKIYLRNLGQPINFGISKACCADCTALLMSDKNVRITGTSETQFPGVYSAGAPSALVTPGRVRFDETAVIAKRSRSGSGSASQPSGVRAPVQYKRSTHVAASPPDTAFVSRTSTSRVATGMGASAAAASAAAVSSLVLHSPQVTPVRPSGVVTVTSPGPVLDLSQ